MQLDRITSTRRPPGKPVGTQSWRDLLFLHWPVAAQQLRALVPPSLELDHFEGTHYIGLVPFVMQSVRTWWMPRGLGLNLLETNVRTYVHKDGQPGVYFFSLDAESLLAVLGARIGFGLPYFWTSMDIQRTGGAIRYRMQRKTGRRPSLAVDYRIGRPLGPSQPESLQFWLVERYLLFVERFQRLHCGQVYHTPYPVQQAWVDHVQDELVASAGLKQPQGPPPLVHYSAGVDVEIFGLKRVGTPR